MGLIDLAGTRFFDRMRERLQVDINADISDILDDVKRYNAYGRDRIKCNIISTWFLSLYNYDAETLHRDIIKMIVLEPVDDISKADKRKLLKALWVSTQGLMGGNDYTMLLNEVNRIIEFNRKYPETDDDGDLPIV